jgi:SAM-dependent methyltransferase
LRQISATTIGQYRAMATSYRDGTWNHDVRQNIQALLTAVTGPPPYRILDLGCGPGRDLVAFRDLGHVVVGLDACPEFVAMARAVSGCEVWQRDMLAMTLPPASFDGVFANAVLFHVPSVALPVVLDRLHDALKPGGVLLASNPRGAGRRGLRRRPLRLLLQFRHVAPAGQPQRFCSRRPILPPARQAPKRATGSPRSGAKRHCQTSAPLAEGATGSAHLVRRLRRFAGSSAP